MSKHETPEGQMDLFKENPDPAVVAEMMRQMEERKKAAPSEEVASSSQGAVSRREKLAGTYCARCQTNRDAEGYCNCNRPYRGEKALEH